MKHDPKSCLRKENSTKGRNPIPPKLISCSYLPGVTEEEENRIDNAG